MATKNTALHYATQQDVQDAADWLDAYGTLDGWQSQNGTGNTADSWKSIWHGMGVNVDDPQAIAHQLQVSGAQYAKGPQTAKIGKLTDPKNLMMLASVAGAAIPGVNTALAKAIGPKAAGLLTGGAKFSNNPMTNMFGQALAAKLVPGYGQAAMIHNIGGAVGLPGAQSTSQIPGMAGYKPQAMPNIAGGIGAWGQAASQGAHDTVGAGGAQGGGSSWMDAIKGAYGGITGDATGGGNWMDSLKGAYGNVTGGSASGPGGNVSGHVGAGMGNAGGQVQGGGSTIPHQGGTQTGQTGGGAGGGLLSGGLGQAALMGLLTKYLDKADSKPSYTGPTAPSGASSLPTYQSSLGLITNQDAAEDQRRRMLAAQGRAA